MKSTAPLRLRVILGLSLLFITVGGIAPPVSASEEDTYTDLRAQGIHYYKRGRHKQARAVLEKVLATPKGQRDPLTSVFLAKTCEAMRRLDLAFPLAQRAVALTKASTPIGKRARGLLGTLKSAYGEVRIESSSETRAVAITPLTRFLNRAKRAHLSSTQRRLSLAPSTFPLTLYLPYGTYRANGTEFTLSSDRDVAMIVQLPDDPTQAASGSTGWIYWTGGVTALVAAGVGTWLLLSDPGPTPAPEYSHRLVIDSGAP